MDLLLPVKLRVADLQSTRLDPRAFRDTAVRLASPAVATEAVRMARTS